MPYFAKPNAFLFKDNAYILRNPTQPLKISFKNLEISENLEMSRKKPGSYGAFQKLPQPENPTQFNTYDSQKSSDAR